MRRPAAAEAFTDLLEHGGRDIQVDLNVSLAGRCSVAVEVSSGTAHASSTPCESGRSSVRGRVGHDFVECFVQGDVPTPGPRFVKKSKPSTSGLFGERQTGTSWKLVHQRIATGSSAGNHSTDVRSLKLIYYPPNMPSIHFFVSMTSFSRWYHDSPYWTLRLVPFCGASARLDLLAVAVRGLPLENHSLHHRRCNWVPTQQCLSNDAWLDIEADTAVAPD